jgi:hypothetical protein
MQFDCGLIQYAIKEFGAPYGRLCENGDNTDDWSSIVVDVQTGFV